ncbi:protein Star-like [Daphnia carinata]|uniref:protein Star-like n=1 Tax=Daphnia carinata TaxID=120202 RepID=UPI00257F613C|nr:protein Star-like [Daphnia carinata]
MKNMVTDCQSRSKIHLGVFFIALVLLVVLLVHPRTEIYNYYQQSQRNQLDTNALSKSGVPVVNHNYNLIGDDVRFGNLSQFFGGQVKSECTLDYMNSKKLQQDHPCVIETIRQHYLNKPSPPNIQLKLDSDDDKDRSPGQTGIIFRLLKNKTNGFFVECGALNGEYMSNSLDLERKYNWGGILIEANPITFQKLLSRNRKAWTLPICLSLEPYPTEVTFQPKNGDPGHSHIEGEAETLQKPGIPGVDPDAVKVQCFPFYSVLLAVGRTDVDFFSLDVEGHELQILKTIPWHKVDIKTLTVEWDNMPEGQEALSRFMEDSGFMRIGAFDFKFTRDVIFVKDLINI